MRMISCFLAFFLLFVGPLHASDDTLEEISFAELKPGDLLFLGENAHTPSITAIYLENNQLALVKAPQEIPKELILSLSDPLLAPFPYRSACRIKESTPTALLHQQETPSSEVTLTSCESSFVNTQALPLVLSYTNKTPEKNALQEWVTYHKSELKNLLSEHGALLLRNFPVETAEDFSWVVKQITGHTPSDYRAGEGSRTKITQGVYTSTEAPLQYKIALHHELSCTTAPLSYLCFYCEIAPPAGTGQTLLGRTEEVTKAIQARPEVWNLFNGKNLRYTSRHPPEGSFFCRVNPTHKTWQSSFETDTQAEVELICQKKGFTYQWLKDWLEVVRIAPAIQGPDTFFNHPYWYNQAHLYHANPRGRGGLVNHILANMLYVMPSTRQYDICFEDGSTISRACIYQIYDALDEKTILFDWQKGDILLLDNRKVLHGRAPCKGPRRVLASMVR